MNSAHSITPNPHRLGFKESVVRCLREIRNIPWARYAGGVLVVFPVQFACLHGNLRRRSAAYGHGNGR